MSKSNIDFTNSDTVSDLKERIATFKWSSGKMDVLFDCLSCSPISSGNAYSEPFKVSDIAIFQLGKCSTIDSSQVPIPDSPVLISWPPPTRHTITAQSGCLSMYEIRYS